MFTLFQRVALWEGISSTLLFFVAMPLKYLAGIEVAVKIVGWAHGLLFIAYIVVLAQCWRQFRWPLRFVGIAALASLLPAGPFFLHPPAPKNKDA